MIPAHVQAALALRGLYARGGSIAPGLPAAPFTAMPTPSVATPGLASPHGLLGARHRTHFADGGLSLPSHVVAALALRPRFDDGGDAGGGGDHGGSGDGGAGDGGSGGSGDGGDGSGAGAGNGNSAGSGAGSGDGMGTGTGTGAGSSGGQSDASTGGADTSSAGSVGSTGTGQSDAATGAANGSDSGIGGAVGSAPAAANPASGVEGAAGLGAAAGYGSATSGPVGSIAGSVGAPAAGGFSSPGAPATGGFGSFSAGPTATSNLGGLSGGTPTASSMSGQTTGQSMASEAASSGDPGEDGTGLGGLGSSPTTAQAFGSFGPAPSSAYGTTASAEQAFGGVAASDLGNVSGLSPTGQQLGALGLGAMPAGMTQSPTGFSNIGAYGLSSVTGGITPGFDNFSGTGDQQQSSLSSIGGYVGSEGNVPDHTIGTLAGPMSGTMTNALQGGLQGAEQQGQTSQDVAATGFSPNYSGFTLGADGQPSFAGNLGVVGDAVTGLKGVGDLANGVVGGVPSSSPVSTNATSATPGVNADGDPTSVDGISALTVHGPVTEAATGGYDAPGPVSTYGGITDQQALDARNAVVAAGGVATPAQAATISGYTAQQNSPVGPTVGLGAAPATNSQPAAAPVGLGVADAAPSAPTDQTTASTVVSPGTLSDYTHRMQAFESGMDPNAISPTGAVGLSQFTQGTWSGIAASYPGLGLPATPAQATPAQYAAATDALTNENVAALQNAGITPTFGAAYLAHNVGISAAVSALSQSDDTPIAQAGIPASSMAVNPAVFSGVQTVGDLKAKLGSIMGQGTVTSSAPSNVASQIGNFGLSQIAAGVPTNIGAYGTPVAHDYGAQPGSPQNAMFGAATTTAHDPSDVSAFTGMASYNVGSDPSFSAAMPTSMQGVTKFHGSPTTYGSTPDTSTSPATPDTSAPSSLSVPKGVTNAIANVGLSSLGPVGMGLAGVNMVSGLLGGPTVGSMVNGALASNGTSAAPATGSQSGGSSQGNILATLASPSGSDDGSASSSSAPTSGTNPLDPHADAMAAYQAAIAGDGPQSTSNSPQENWGYQRALTIRGAGNGAPVSTPAPLYNPMQDPSVLHALGLSG